MSIALDTLMLDGMREVMAVNNKKKTTALMSMSFIIRIERLKI